MTDQQAVEEWVPTVNDLRVKRCYICYEEEFYDNPEDPPRAWTHPCSCTLVAHESCLLQWIKSSQQDPARANKALKCPQCGATYELESDNPLLLRILNALNGALSATATIVGFTCGIASFGITIYVVSTSYGAYAVKEFIGEEMFNLLLTDDPGKWPPHAYIHLPIIPFSLILSRTGLFDSLPMVPLLLTWATTPPINASSSASLVPPSLSNFWGLIRGRPEDGTPFSPALNWPPTPFMITVLFPFIRIAYRRAFHRLTTWVMGSANAESSTLSRVRRIILAMNEGPAQMRVRIGVNVQRPNGQAQPRANADANNANANAPAEAAAGAGEAAAPADNVLDDAPEDVVADAERTLHVTTSSLTRFIGGALLIPTIANRMGALLFRLSRHSSFLRLFLAIRERPAQLPTPNLRIQLFPRPGPDGQAGFLRQFSGGVLAGINVLAGGTPTWNAHDPVWWRNAVGLGVFVFTKDCIRLLHLWLTKRELESRRVKNRSFAGVDIKELDLIRPPSSAPGTTEEAT
ncbi:hypothetical protein C8Q77DRAFT_1120476 [Trametes polyzona]|nr:hypothetical protein C8Q77DRAFT_1120476 [Trametes polyzona]